MKIGFAITGIIVVIGLVIFTTAIADRRQLSEERAAIATQWAQVDQVLQRRAEVAAALIEAVKAHAGNEKEAVKHATEARAALLAAVTPQDRIRANVQLDTAISRLLLLAEQYPSLKASANFLHTEDDLAAIENRIAIERRNYNEAVQRYNTDLELFPKNVAAALFGFERNDTYFKTEPGAPAPPRVKF